MTEVGLPHVDAKLWYAFLAPSKTPADRITRLYNAFAEIYPVHAVEFVAAGVRGFRDRALHAKAGRSSCCCCRGLDGL